jgi:predicted O-methyltransferase YrrM
VRRCANRSESPSRLGRVPDSINCWLKEATSQLCYSLKIMLRRLAHWTPHYIYSRLRVEQFRRKHNPSPNFATGAIEFLAQALKPTDVMLEYGSGYSTAWFGKRVAKLISIEHDQAWYERVRMDLAAQRLTNVELRLLTGGGAVTGAAPGIGANYLLPLSEYLPDSFDVVLNDGFARAYVSERLDLVKPGGMFIWDDYAGAFPISTNIPYSLPANAVVTAPQLLDFMRRTASWRKIIYDDGVHCTAVLLRV